MKYLMVILLALSTCPPLSNAVTISAGHTTGVAPLMVHVYDSDMTASDGVGIDEVLDYHYAWDFGDVGSGNWGTSGKPKNTDSGIIAGHVYETAGTYTITLNVYNSSTGVLVGSDTEVITITDPGMGTVCYSDTADFDGCPSGATTTQVTDLSTIVLTNGDRHLFRRGGAWSTSSAIPSTDGAGPTIIGAFGTCLSPDAQGICSNAPEITANGGFIDINDKSGWRIMDISIVGTVNNAAVGQLDDFFDILYLRIKQTGASTGLGWSVWHDSTITTIDRMAIVDCQITGNTAYNLFIGGERVALLGTIADDANDSHSVRVWQGFRALIAHNRISGGRTGYSFDGRTALKLHGPPEPGSAGSIGITYCTPANGNACQTNRTQFVQLSDNVFGGSGPWPVSIGPPDALSYVEIRDVVIERNKFFTDFGTVGVSVPVQVSLHYDGLYGVVRNNLIDGTNSSNGWTGVHIADRGAYCPPPQNIGVYNNTVYSSDNITNTLVGIHVDEGSADIAVINNIVSFPNETSEVLLLDESSLATNSNNILIDTPYFADPDNAAHLSRDFRLTSDSISAIGQGLVVPVFEDFDGTLRSTPYDIGAFAYGEYVPPDPTCSDGVQNGDETGIDCGGSCPNPCEAPPALIRAFNAGQGRVTSGAGRWISN